MSQGYHDTAFKINLTFRSYEFTARRSLKFSGFSYRCFDCGLSAERVVPRRGEGRFPLAVASFFGRSGGAMHEKGYGPRAASRESSFRNGSASSVRRPPPARWPGRFRRMSI